jgi:hypothetical protein
MKIYYVIYKTTNLINGRYYIGKHQTVNLDDNYYGSGKLILLAIKKYGIKNFQKELLFVFDTEAEMNNKEIEMVSEKFIKDRYNYNCGVGGEGGPHFKGKKHTSNTRDKISFALKGYKHSEQMRNKVSENNRKRIFSDESKEKMSKSRKLRVKQIKHSEETKIKISIGVKKSILLNESVQSIRREASKRGGMNGKGKKMSDEAKKKISDALKLRHMKNREKNKPKNLKSLIQ